MAIAASRRRLLASPRRSSARARRAASRHAGAQRAPNFARDVAPIVREKCAGCHRDGGIAPFAFRTERDLASRAARSSPRSTDGRMPPWPPSARLAAVRRPGAPHARRAASATRSSAGRASQLVAPGAARRRTPVGAPPPSGDRSRAPGETLLELAMPAAYLPTATNGATDDYRCFLLDPKLTEDAFVTSTRIEPGAASLVHHVILFRVRAGIASARRGARPPHAAAPAGRASAAPGVSGRDERTRAGSSTAPAGSRPGRPGCGADRSGRRHRHALPAGKPDRDAGALQPPERQAARSLACRADDRAGRPRADARSRRCSSPRRSSSPAAKGETGTALRPHRRRLRPDRRSSAHDAALIPTGLLLLCGKDAAQPVADAVATCDRAVDRPTTIHAVGGHMHLLGSSIRIELNPGTTRARLLLEIPRWNFHWQAVVPPRPTRPGGPGDVLRVTCRARRDAPDAASRATCSGARGRPTRCASASSRSPAAARATRADPARLPDVPRPGRAGARHVRRRPRGGPRGARARARAGGRRPPRRPRRATLRSPGTSCATARRFRPDVVYAHFLVPAGLLGALAGRAPPVAHRARPGRRERGRASRAVRAATRLAVRRAAAIVAVSGWLRVAARVRRARRRADETR